MTKFNPFTAHPVKQNKMVDLFNPGVQSAVAGLAVHSLHGDWMRFKRGFDVGTQRVKTPLYKQTADPRSSGSAETKPVLSLCARIHTESIK